MATPAPASRDQLAREHMNLAHALAWKAWVPGEDRDELEGDALLGLAQAINTWTPGNGSKFSSWAFQRITWTIKDGKRQRDHLHRSHRQAVTLAGVVATDEQPPNSLDQVLPDTDGITAADSVASPGDEFGLVDTRDAIRRLPARERLVFLLHSEHGLRLHEIGELLGVTEGRVCQIHHGARKHLAATLGTAVR